MGPDRGLRELVLCRRSVGRRQSSALPLGNGGCFVSGGAVGSSGGILGRWVLQGWEREHGGENRGAAQGICSGRWVGFPRWGHLGRVRGVLVVTHLTAAPQSLQSLQRGCAILKSLLRIAPGVLSPFLQVQSAPNKLPTPCCLLQSPPLVKSEQLSFRINLKRPGNILPCWLHSSFSFPFMHAGNESDLLLV